MRSKADEHREVAASCVRMAEQTTDAAAKASLLEMARIWLTLAEQAERNSRTDIVYEPPPAAPEPRQQVAQQQQQIQPDEDNSG